MLKKIRKEPMYIEDEMIQLELLSPTDDTPDNRSSPDDRSRSRAVSEPLGAKGPEIIRIAYRPSLKLTRSNSTSSIFIKDTICLPNIYDLTSAMAIHLRKKMESSRMDSKGVLVDIFSETLFPLTNEPRDTFRTPSVETIFHFLNTIFQVEKLPPEVGIMSLVYIDRLLIKTGISFHASNWRRIMLSALILASKVWEDQAIWNADFIELFPNISVRDLNHMEQYLLKYLEFNVGIKPSQYVKVYFHLRNHIPRKLVKEHAENPMDADSLKKLQIRIALSQNRLLEAEEKFSLSKSDSFAENFSNDLKKPKHGFGIIS